MRNVVFIAAFLSLAMLRAADEAPARPGFWERAWQSTKRAGSKTLDVATSPFRRSERKGADSKPGNHQLAISITLDPPVVKLSQTRVVEVNVGVVNKGKEAAQLEFPNSQRIEVLLRNEAGKVLSRWSDDQRVEKEAGLLLINPGERIEYSARVSTRDMTPGQPCIIEAFFPAYESLRTARMLTPVR